MSVNEAFGTTIITGNSDQNVTIISGNTLGETPWPSYEFDHCCRDFTVNAGLGNFDIITDKSGVIHVIARYTIRTGKVGTISLSPWNYPRSGLHTCSRRL